MNPPTEDKGEKSKKRLECQGPTHWPSRQSLDSVCYRQEAPSVGFFTPPISFLCVQDAGGKEADIFVGAFVLETI